MASISVTGSTTGLSASPPAASVPPRGSQAFTASGGSGAGYTWTLSANNSGGSIGASGLYTAGTTGNVTDVVQVTDSLGNVQVASVSVWPLPVDACGDPETTSSCGGCQSTGESTALFGLLALWLNRRLRRSGSGGGASRTTRGSPSG